MLDDDEYGDVDEGLRLSKEIERQIGEAKLIPVFRCPSGAEALTHARALLEAGESLVEVAATTPEWHTVVAALRNGWPSATIGVGTVIAVADAKRALDSGADFLVSPHLAPHLREQYGRYLIEGGFTPGEVAQAASYGLAKLFPAHVGGVAYLRSLLAVYPGRRIMPTGGLRLDEASDWLAAGAYAVGIGSGFTGLEDPVATFRQVRADSAGPTGSLSGGR